jgi:flagellar hook-length control protein FliK
LSPIQSGPAKPFSAPTKSSGEIAAAPLPEIVGANDTTQQLPSVSFQQHTIPAVASTQPAGHTADLSQLNLVEDAGWIDMLACDIAKCAAGDGRLNFRLLPERLGQLDIVVNHSKGHVDIIMQASTDVAASIIVADQLRLIEELRQSGLRVGNFEMTSGQHGGFSRQQYASPSGAPDALPRHFVTPQRPREPQKRSDRFA